MNGRVARRLRREAREKGLGRGGYRRLKKAYYERKRRGER